ncbi:MAG TPA: regulatory protein RecX [Gaiellaceae bacterium]
MPSSGGRKDPPTSLGGAAESTPLDLAARALAHRDRSRRQVGDRLAKAGVDEDERGDVLDALERIGYVDDDRYAGSRAESLARRGYGDEAIRHFLEADGIDTSRAEAAIGALRPEPERAEELVGRLGATGKTLAALQRKGFAPESLERFAAGGAEA